MRVLRQAAAVILVLLGIVGMRASFASITYEVGARARVFKPGHARNWRGAKTEALVTTIWYPVSAVARLHEEPQVIGPSDKPLFFAGAAAVDAPIAEVPEKFPVVMLSHGTGGSAMQMAWLGTVLARHGYIAVAVNHPGNNALEPYTAEGFALWWERAIDISDAVDALLKDSTFGPRVDATRIGAAGFSIGGYTVLELAGARTTQADFLAACAAEPTLPTCRVPEMKNFGSPEDITARVKATSAESLARGGDSYRDPRIRAVFAVAPAVGQAFREDAFREVGIPVAMVVGAADPIAPAAANAAKFKKLMPRSELTILPGEVSHYTFLDTCTDAGKAKLGVYCADAAGVDREKVHATVTSMAVKFFDQNLR
ncbi:dienelactone hydrolase family protein [Granulicella sp. S190]|uniref:alpha/beta hydrolase family protein n=1 Tax=Granulicella sp. S190 TaxID=1747226 RepID=UPI00131CDDAA|nr:peptidase [Granulicella sp. S190]